MKRYIKANTNYNPDVNALMVIVFSNEYSDLNDFGRKLFDNEYPGWNDTDNIRKYFYTAFEIDNSIKSLFRLADSGDVNGLKQTLSDLEYLGGEHPYEKWLTEKLILFISSN